MKSSEEMLKNIHMTKVYELVTKKRSEKHKISFVGYTLYNWVLKKLGIGIVHTQIWSKKGGENKTKVRITIEEI